MNHNMDTSVFGLLTKDAPNPALQTNFDISIDPAHRIQLLSVNFSLTTDANVANRLVRIKSISETFSCNYAVAPVVQTAGKTIIYNFGLGLPPLDLTASGLIQCTLPNMFFLEAIDDFESDCLALQATDSIANIRYKYKYWNTY